jgi:hypothetical protein
MGTTPSHDATDAHEPAFDSAGEDEEAREGGGAPLDRAMMSEGATGDDENPEVGGTAAAAADDQEPSVPPAGMVNNNRRRRSTVNPVEVPVWSTEASEANRYLPKLDGSAINPTSGGKLSANLTVTNLDLERMKDTVFFLHPDRSERFSSFWILLILAAIIATSGVVSDSAATVIGASKYRA